MTGLLEIVFTLVFVIATLWGYIFIRIVREVWKDGALRTLFSRRPKTTYIRWF